MYIHVHIYTYNVYKIYTYIYYTVFVCVCVYIPQCTCGVRGKPTEDASFLLVMRNRETNIRPSYCWQSL